MPVTVDLRGLRARHARMRQNAEAARRAALHRGISLWAHEVAERSPRDTNRFVRGWIQAAQAVGVTGLIEPIVQSSKYLEVYVEAYEFEIARLGQKLWAAHKTLTQGVPGRGGTLRPVKGVRRARLEQTRASLLARIAAKREELRKLLATEGAIVIGAGKVWLADDGPGIALSQKSTRPTVRLKIYGGQGRVYETQGRSVYILHNLEPHTSLVEFRHKVAAQARDGLQFFGIKAIRQVYLNRVLGRSAPE